MGVVAALALYALMAPVLATAQEANMSTTVASLGSGTATSRINLDAVKPKPATDRGLALPSLALIDDGSGPRVTSLVLELPDLDLGEVSVASRLGDQSLPAVFRAAPLAGSALASPMRGLTFTTTGTAPLSLSFGQMPAPATGTPPGSPAFAAAAVSFTPSTRLSLTPHVLIPSGSPDAQTSVGTAIQANVVGNLALVTDVGMAGTADTAWAPLASARLVGQWPRAGIETSVLRGAAAPRAEADKAFVSSRDREAVQAQVQPLPGLTLAALTSSSRPSSDPDADDTTLGSLRIAYDGLPTGQVAAVRQRETTASRESEITSLEWRQRGLGRMTVRYVHQRASDSALAEADEGSSRVEVDLPVARAPQRGPPGLARRAHGGLQLADRPWRELQGQRPGGPDRRCGAHGRNGARAHRRGRAGVARPARDDGDAGRPGDTSPALLRLPRRRALPPRPGVRSAHLAAASAWAGRRIRVFVNAVAATGGRTGPSRTPHHR